MATVVSNATIITVDAADRVLANCDIRIDGNRIDAIGDTGAVSQPGDLIVDATGAVIVPGLVNVHTHAATGLFRGLADDQPKSFWSPAFRVPGQERFTPDDYRSSLAAVCAESLLNGVTCIADRLAGMDQLAPVIEASGLRAVVGQTISDNREQADWATTDRVIEMFGVNPRRRVHAGIAPHALDSCSDALLAECAARAEKLGCRVFLHVAQSEVEVETVRRRGHDGALACLERAGLVGAHVVAAHGIYLNSEEIDSWPRSKISIAHCPASNLKIEARTLPVHRLHGRVAIGLGTDWAATNNAWDLLAEARLAALVGKMLANDPTVLPVSTMMRMATIDGARVLGLDHVTGSIEVGKSADLVVFDGSKLCMTPAHDPVSNVLYAASPRAVRDVMVDGIWRVRGGKLVGADEASLARAHNATVRQQ